MKIYFSSEHNNKGTTKVSIYLIINIYLFKNKK